MNKANQLYAPWLHAMARVFEKAGVPLYLVGGAVRNRLMGIPLSDVDVCGPARPERVCELCEGTEVRAVLRAAHFGTVELHMRDENDRHHMAEYTTFREDSYRCGHRPSAIRFTEDIGVDALRRDFSVNALYRRIRADGVEEVIDPTGGLAHLTLGVLHTVTEDPDRVLKDDGLRILRAARFQAELALAPTNALLASAARHVGLLGEIARERLGEECKKVLMADFRYPQLPRMVPATESGMKTIGDIGAWECLFGGLPYREANVHALARLEAVEGVDTAAARMALLFWQDAEERVDAAMAGLHFSGKQRAQVGVLCRWMQSVARKKATRMEAATAGMAAVLFACTAFAAVEQAPAENRARELLETLVQPGAVLSLKALSVNGHDLLALCENAGQPASRVGVLLQVLWRETLEERIPNEREALLQAAQAFLDRDSGL